MQSSSDSASSSSSAPVVLVTGAAGGGIGTHACIRFAQEGYSVVATDITDLAALEKELQSHLKPGAEVLGIRLDVCSSKSVNDGVAQVLAKFGRIDVLVNNAAKGMGTDILKLSEETWDANVTLVLKSVYLLSRAVVPEMITRGGGAIVNVSSVNGQAGFGEEAYGAAKAGVINLTQNLAVRYGSNGIRANCVAPGTIETHLWSERIAKNPGIMKTLQKYYPLGRIGKPEDVANAIYFLASKQASWITGTTINVDGGLMAGSSGLIKDLVPEGTQ